LAHVEVKPDSTASDVFPVSTLGSQQVQWKQV
jgi:hypothetical protein